MSAAVQGMMGRTRSCRKRRLVFVASATIALLLAAVGVRPVAADMASDKPAAIIVFPKLLVDTTNGVDTLIRISNTSDTSLNIHCFYVNATPHCNTATPDPNSCFREGICSSSCNPQWNETDFEFTLTAQQPTGWLVSQGTNLCLSPLLPDNRPGVCSNDPGKICGSNGDCGSFGSGARCIIPPCFPLLGPPFQRPDGAQNFGAVPLSPEDPFIGELKCLAVDDTGAPTDRNDMKGEALIGKRNADGSFIDVSGYNAIGFPAIPDASDRDNTLVLGGPTAPVPCTSKTDCPTGIDCVNNFCNDPCETEGLCAEYEGCPNILILNHFFDGAVDPTIQNVCRDHSCSISETPCSTDDDCVNHCVSDTCTLSSTSCDRDSDCSELPTQARINTNITLMPCTEDFRGQQPGVAIAQMIIFNEFENRFSTSITVQCFEEIQLSSIGTNQNDRSIFSVGVGGTLTGQTRISGVVPNGSMVANGLMGVAEEFRCRGPDFPLCNTIKADDLISSASFNLHFQGTRPQSDFIYLP